MAKLFLDTTDTSYKVSSSNTTVFGAGSDQAVIIDGALTGIVLDANVERVQFTGATTDYTYKQVGTDLEVYNAAGTLVTKVGLQDDTTGTQLTFANGTVKAAFAPSATGLGVTVGGATVSTTTAAAVTPTTIDTTLASTPLPSFSVTGAASVTEAGTALFTVTLANPSATASTTVKYTIAGLTTTAAADFGDETATGTNVTAAYDATATAGTLTFAPGATTAQISVPVTFDSITETGEGISLTLSNPSAGVISSTGASVTTTFADAPAPTFTMTSSATAGVSVQEGNTITFTVTPSSVVNADTVLNLNMAGVALGAITSTTSAGDFSTTSAVTFPAGSSAAKTITVTVVNDSVTEGLEAYKAQLLDSTFTEKAAVQGTITDALPTLTLSQANATVNEGGANTYTITSSAAAPAGGLTVPYTVTGTATSGSDYTAVTGTATIAAGATTGTFTVTTTADRVTETTETLIVSLGTTTGANLSTVAGATTATTTILDTSTTPVAGAVTLSSSAATITETAGTNVVTYTVELGSAAPAGGVTIPYTLSGAATLTTDYTGASATTGNFTIAAGATTGTLVLTTVADATTEATAEAITLTLGTLPTGYTLAAGTTNTTTTAITDTSVAVAGSTFTLTSAIDNITGTAGNDTIVGDSTFTSGADQIDGGAGTDTLKLVGTTTKPTLTNVEAITLDQYGNNKTFDVSNVTGVTALKLSNQSTQGTGDSTFTIGASQTVTIENVKDTANDGNELILSSASSVTANTLVLVGAGDPATSGNDLEIEIQGTAVATLNLSTATSASRVSFQDETTNGDFAVATVNVTGSQNLTVDAFAASTASRVTFAATDFTGVLDLNLSATEDFTVNAGSGNDRFNLGAAFNASEKLAGGTGTNTLAVSTATINSTFAGYVDGKTNNVANNSNIQALEYTGTSSYVLDASLIQMSTLTSYKTTGTIVGTAGANGGANAGTVGIAVTGESNAQTYSIEGNVTGGAGGTAGAATHGGAGAKGVTFAPAVDNGSNVLNLSLKGVTVTGGAGQNGGGGGAAQNGGDAGSAIDFSNFETINITSTGATSTAVNTFTAGAAGALAAGGANGAAGSTVIASSNATFNISGANEINLGTINTTNTPVTVNAANLTGKLTVGSGTAADVFTAGSGINLITLAGGVDTVDLTRSTAKADVITTTAATNTTSTSFVKISGFTNVLTNGDKLDTAATASIQADVSAGTATGVTNLTGSVSSGILSFAGSAASTATLADKVTAATAAAFAGTANEVLAFEHGGNTYVFAQVGTNDAFNAGTDQLIELTGVTGVTALSTSASAANTIWIA